jgi:hypothetical protein
VVVLGIAGCAPGTQTATVSASLPSPHLSPIPNVELSNTLAFLKSHTLACAQVDTGVAVALDRYECRSPAVGADTTAESVATIDASPDGRAIYRIFGDLLMVSGSPNDSMAEGFFANVLGSVPFAEVEQEAIIRWVHSAITNGGTATFGPVTFTLSGPPIHRSLTIVAG